MPQLIQDARSFYHTIKQNKFYDEADDESIVAVLEDQLEERLKACRLDHRAGKKRDSYLFFQGAMMGTIIAAKQWRHHLEVVKKMHDDAARKEN